jgi:hypothetical protein
MIFLKTATKSFALAIIAGGVSGELSMADAEIYQSKTDASMGSLSTVRKEKGPYVSESNYFERSWSQAFWGSHYVSLPKIKHKYDPAGLFFMYHGAGSETWTADGFEKTM